MWYDAMIAAPPEVAMARAAHRRRSVDASDSWEQQYVRIVSESGAVRPRLLPDSESLEQPSPLTIVPSVVTYGAYEEPIVAAEDA